MTFMSYLDLPISAFYMHEKRIKLKRLTPLVYYTTVRAIG